HDQVRRKGRAHLAASILPLLKLGEGGLDRRRVDHRDRALTVGTARLFVQADWRSAIRAAYDFDLFSKLVDLANVERADDVLFAEELEQGDEVPVVLRAAKVVETGVSLDVHGVGQSVAAARAGHLVREGHRRVGARAHQPNQFQRRARSQLKMLFVVEPKGAAGVTGVDDDLNAVIPLERVLLHRLPAAGAVHRASGRWEHSPGPNLCRAMEWSGAGCPRRWVRRGDVLLRACGPS